MISKVQDMLFYLIRLQQIHKITSYLRQSQTRSPPNPLIRKSRDRVPHTKCSGITFKTRTKNKPYSKVLVARLTVLKYHKFLNRHGNNHEPSRTTLATNSLFRVGKIFMSATIITNYVMETTVERFFMERRAFDQDPQE